MKRLSTLDEKEFVKTVENLFKDSMDETYDWRQESMESRDYVAGNQWTQEDLGERDGRPSVTYNRTGPFVDAIVGMHVQNRQEVRYLPRTMNDAPGNEVLNSASEWARDTCDAEDEETDAFVDLVTTGAGAIETRISFDRDPEGEFEETRIDWVNELFWDPQAKRRNFHDKRWVMHVKPWDKDDIEDEWPESDITGGVWEENQNEWWQPDIHRADKAWMYKNDSVQRLPKETQMVVTFEWYEIEKKHRIIWQGQPVDVSISKFKALKPALDENGVSYTTQPIPMRKYYRAFITGKTLLERGPAPIDRFSFDIMTGKRDQKKKSYYGIVRSLKDPQRWANVFFSSILHTLATSGKGMIAEENAFENIHKAREQWGKPDEIVITNPGALQAGKIQPKPPTPYPNGLDRMMEHSIAAFNDVTGIPVELLGLSKGEQPGIVEAHRKQSGIAILSWAFDAFRKFRKEQGRTMAEYLLKYLSNGRLIRITDEQRYVPFVRQPGLMKFDVIVDDAPTSPNQKERVWAIMQGLLPYMVQMGVPVPKDIFDYLPVPEQLKQSWKEQMEPDPQQQQMQMQMQQRAQQMQEIGFMSKVERDKAAAQKDQTTAQLQVVKAQKEQALIKPEVEKTVQETEKLAAETGQTIAGG